MNYEFGAEILDEFLSLPRRAQELLVAYMFRKDINASELLSFIMIRNCIAGESPIEVIFSMAYELVLYENGLPYSELFSLESQVPFEAAGKKYIADYVIATGISASYEVENDLTLIIECDGHDFHEKTKKQVEYRNNRDFDLKSIGCDILHFSGSQIYKDPIKCASDVLVYALSKVGKITEKNYR